MKSKLGEACKNGVYWDHASFKSLFKGNNLVSCLKEKFMHSKHHHVMIEMNEWMLDMYKRAINIIMENWTPISWFQLVVSHLGSW